MKTVFLATVAASAALASAAAGAPTASLPPSTGPDLSVLSTRESAVVAQLKAFPKLGSRASVSRWESGLKADEAAQTKAEAALNADLVTTPRTVTKPAATPALARIGSTLSFEDSTGNPYSVRLIKTIDPARGADQYTRPIPGTRFVAAVFTITDTGTHKISDDANSNASVTGSNDESFLSEPDSLADCTNFNGGTYQLAPHQSQTGCVAFQIPNGVTMSTVEWSPGGRYIPGFQAWRAP